MMIRPQDQAGLETRASKLSPLPSSLSRMPYSVGAPVTNFVTEAGSPDTHNGPLFA